MPRLFDDLRHDLAYGIRMLARGPGFALTTITVLAIAIGANTARSSRSSMRSS